MKYILIIIVLGSGSPDVSLQEFDDEIACENAKTFVVKSLQDQFIRKSVVDNAITVKCVPKAAESE